MKTLIIAVCLAGFPLLTRASWSQPACPVSVEAMVEVSPRGFSLADLLTKDTCPALLRAATHVRLGAAPLIGSARVLEAAEVRSLVQKAAATMPSGAGPLAIMRIPERVIVRRTGPRASCADVAKLLLEPPGKTPVAAGLRGAPRSDTAPQETTSPELQCGGADRIPQGSVLERTKTAWNPALDTWDVSLRCVHHTDCVPFLVRIRNVDASQETAHNDAIVFRDPRINPPPAFHVVLNGARAPGATAMVRRGQTVKLLWDQYGVRLLVPAICLDSGDQGERVRARIARGGRVVPAIVVNAGELRTAL